jgi:hypothetical protein
MSDTILNPDGSVYMTFGPSAPSPADLEGWYVRTITSADTRLGTFALLNTECESFNSLLRHVGAMRAACVGTLGGTEVHTSFGEGLRHYRWTWERFTPSGERQTDTVIASRIH